MVENFTGQGLKLIRQRFFRGLKQRDFLGHILLLVFELRIQLGDGGCRSAGLVGLGGDTGAESADFRG